MSHQGQHRCLNFVTSPLVTDAVLAIAILFTLTVASTQSAQAQIYTERVLYSFTGPPDGNTPYSGLVRDAQGNLYGTTYRGGDLACTYGCGTVFKVDTTGKETLLYSFSGGDGALSFIKTSYTRNINELATKPFGDVG